MKRSLLCAVALTALATPAFSADDPILVEGPTAKVTVSDFEGAMTRFPPELRDAARSMPETIQRVVDSVYVNRVLAQRAREAGLDKDPIGTTRIQQVAEGFLATRYLETLQANAKVPNLEARAKEVYVLDPAQFKQEQTATIAYVVVSHMNRTPEMAKARANEARQKLLAGVPLATVSQEYSDATPAVKKTGEMGEFRREDMQARIAEYAFKAPLNQWSEPIAFETATHLVLVRSRKAERQLTFDEVKVALIEAETGKIRKNASTSVIDAVRADKAVRIDARAMDALRSKVDPSKMNDAQRSAIRDISQQP